MKSAKAKFWTIFITFDLIRIELNNRLDLIILNYLKLYFILLLISILQFIRLLRIDENICRSC